MLLKSLLEVFRETNIKAAIFFALEKMCQVQPIDVWVFPIF